jgi:hypothetical protein
MTIPRVLLGLALLAALAPAASALNAFAGVVSQGETKSFTYSSEPPKGSQCIQMATTYTVTLTYAPGSDVLTLNVPGHGSVSGSGASVSFLAGVCTTFGFSVTGTSVADKAAFVVQVTSGALGQPIS